jgi:hypothetical protein
VFRTHELLALLDSLQLSLPPGVVRWESDALPNDLVHFDDEQKLVHRELGRRLKRSHRLVSNFEKIGP